jgi:hypothetical protein
VGREGGFGIEEIGRLSYKFKAVEYVCTKYQGEEVKPPIREAVNNYPWYGHHSYHLFRLVQLRAELLN